VAESQINTTCDLKGLSIHSIIYRWGHIGRNNGSEEESVSSIDEYIESNNNGNEEVINQEAVNSHEAVTQQVSHNVTQLSHHTVKEEDNHDCLPRIGLYTPSSFMQSLRIKYQVVGLEGHAWSLCSYFLLHFSMLEYLNLYLRRRNARMTINQERGNKWWILNAPLSDWYTNQIDTGTSAQRRQCLFSVHRL